MYEIASDVAGLYGEKLAVALGFLTLVSAIVTFTSCRSFLRLFKFLHLPDPMDVKIFRPFYKYHAYYWVFLLALFLHLVTALIHVELPTPGDPDALIHWVILGFAFGALVSLVMVLVSCRSFTGLIGFFLGKNPLTINYYSGFYRYHSLYWWLFVIAVVGHLSASYVHIGFWP
jgi:hypothetical protein